MSSYRHTCEPGGGDVGRVLPAVKKTTTTAIQEADSGRAGFARR